MLFLIITIFAAAAIAVMLMMAVLLAGAFWLLQGILLDDKDDAQ